VQASGKRKIVAVVLGLALVVALGAFVASDPGDPSIPDGAVAVVEDAPDGTITDEEFDENLRQAAFNLQLRELPAEDDPQFEQIEQSALSNSIQTRWVKGEAEERGVEASEQDVDRALDQIIEQQLGGQKGYEQFLERSEVDGEPAFDEEAVRAVAELTAISSKLQDEIATPEVTDEQVERFYDQNADQFETPESRDVRVILNPDVAEIDKALDELGDSPTPDDWDAVAKKYSTDEATKNQGGLRTAVTEGQNEPALDDAIFNTEEGEVVGPIEGESGFYAIQVEGVTPGETTPLDGEGCDTPEAQDPCLREQIETQLQQGNEAQAIDTFRQSFIAKWTSRTFCGSVKVDLCANADPPPEACTIDDDSEREAADPATLDAGCPAFALPRNVVNPGTGGVFPGEQLPVLPQGPYKPAAEQPALPPGVAPVGPGGAPPPTGAPPQGAPPAGAPPAGAPPAQP
jgi:parvulin-like peptidyl-prolyl isomerase